MNALRLSQTRNLFISLLILLSAAFGTSCGEGNSSLSIPGVDGPKIELQEDNVILSMVFENIPLSGGFRYDIPQYQNSYVSVEPDLLSDGTLMKISISLQDIFNDELQLLPPQQLPGGRDLPGVASGRLPAAAFSIPRWNNLTFYLGPKFFGVFVPVKLNIGTNNIITARYKIGDKRAGNISIVGPDDNGENSGFVLLLDLNSSVKRKLKSIQKKFD